MPPKKKAPVDRQPITIVYTVQPAFYVVADAPRLSGISGIGKTAREAINSLRAEVKRRYPDEQYSVTETASNIELWKATGWKEATYDDIRV